MTLTYRQAVGALTERGRFGISLGLERVERLMEEVGHPERGLRGALVGGTNGKGSVVAMTVSILGAAGLRVGSMPKPHLVSYRERIAVDGRPLDEDAFAAAIERVMPAIDRVAADVGPPTEFEALTAAAIAELARERVDLAIVEVGLGGRLDATNVLDLGVAAITNVQLDHEAILGPTLAAIGGEKAPIIKSGDVAVTGAAGRGLRPILDRAAALDVPLLRAGPHKPYRAVLRKTGWDGIVVDARTPARRLEGLRIGLLGRHQADNAAVALGVIDALAERWGVSVDDASLRQGMATARWPGRLEVLDGPHRRAASRPARRGPQPGRCDGARPGPRRPGRPSPDDRLRRDADEEGPRRAPRPRTDRPALRLHLGRRSRRTRPGDPGAAWRSVSGASARTAPDPAAALALADGDPVVVAGSLYLVGAVRGMLTGSGEES